MKLWQKHTTQQLSGLQQKVEAFTIGNDRHWDTYLAEADVLGSMAHAEMLHAVGLLSAEDHRAIQKGLEDILIEIKEGRFVIEDGVEDVHSQIELLLTRNQGEAGKKIHSARSRNDQALTDIKLFIRAQLRAVADQAAVLFDTLINLSETHKDKLLPGYTHMQLAMPSSFGLWFGAFAESLCDDLELLIAARHIANRNPLGSGAGYGSSFPIDRQRTTESLGFESMNYNVVYAQMTRGKTEKTAAMALASVASTLSKLAMDMCLYCNQNFGFIRFPDELTTGSSIMPHKKNPDVFELIRAKCNRIQALPNELTLLTNNLPSGYHRDMQLTKECLFPAFGDIIACMDMAVLMLQYAEVEDDLLADARYQHLYTVETVNKLVLSGVPFRDAYRQVAEQVQLGAYAGETQLQHTHEGSMGNLCNDKIGERFYRLLKQLE